MKYKVRTSKAEIMKQFRIYKNKLDDYEKAMSSKQFGKLWKQYADYRDEYLYAKIKMKSKGLEMNDSVMDFDSYRAVRSTMDPSKLNNSINKQLVDDQRYEYSMEVAKAIKEAFKERGDELGNKRIRDLRTGKDIDLSAINDQLRASHPEMSGWDRADWISHNVFGSDPKRRRRA